MSRDWWIVVNPASGRGGDNEARLAEALRTVPEVTATTNVSRSPQHLADLIDAGVDSGHTRFGAVGGDGTAHLVVNALLAHEWLEPPVLAVLPAGSGSDFNRTFAHPQELPPAVRRLTTDDTYLVDVGRISGSFGNRLFLNAANVGVAAGSVAVAARLPRRLGAVRYATGFWLALARYRSLPITVQVGKRKFEGDAISVVVANGQFFGGGMNVAPKAMLGDGELDVQVFSGPRRMAFTVMPRVKRGLHLRHPAVRRMSGSSITVDCPDDWPVEADGEMLGTGPVRVEVLPEAIAIKI